jgi:hypothetical protein
VEEAGVAASASFAVMAQRGGAVMRHRKGDEPEPRGWSAVMFVVFERFSMSLNKPLVLGLSD